MNRLAVVGGYEASVYVPYQEWKKINDFLEPSPMVCRKLLEKENDLDFLKTLKRLAVDEGSGKSRIKAINERILFLASTGRK